ncbi:MAG: sigma-54 dependent transcriptional regulator [Spirochaetaceae bacterium]|jgi:DNA-binding NtrC family response regulator|nr:sigma-54 dependent transcriptional regulator [Spirochaetaceae bacterium]
MKFKILIADDEKNIRNGLVELFKMEGYEVEAAEDGDEAYRKYQKGDIDLVVTDLRMPGMPGEEFLKRIKSETPGVPVIVLTGHGTVKEAVQAMKEGAWDFLTKPIQDLDRLILIVRRALGNRERRLKHEQIEKELELHKQSQAIIGDSVAMHRVMDLISRAAPTRASILITGESGVGKEIVANAIQKLSPRKDKPFIKVHCAALAESLLESELFGHEKGAFTGASGRRRGKFELAHEGTLFLDEIGEIDQNIQIKLLRVLQERKFERVGGEETVDIDIRLIAATNKDLKAEIDKGNFREDLYYRLNVVAIPVPPLRERKEDLYLLINSFLKTFAAENNKEINGLDAKVLARLNSYDWPGNIRELRNCMESAVVMAKGRHICEDDLPPNIQSETENGWIRIPMGTTLEKAEELIIRDTLSAQKYNKTETAKILGIGRKTLHRKLDEYDVLKDTPPDEEGPESEADTPE